MIYIGEPVKRIEDFPLLTGKAKFVADITLPDQLHMRVVRSPIAFGKILDIDTHDAREMPGVFEVWTSANVADLPPIDFRQARMESLEFYKQPILAKDVVRYVGEPIAVVFADDPYRAEDGAEMIFADIEEAQPCLRATDTQVQYSPDHSNLAGTVVKEYGNLTQAFQQADKIVELSLSIGRHSGIPMETRGCIATYDIANDVIRFYGASKIPHKNRAAIASMLKLSLDQVHFYEGHVGGGFGVRGEIYPEDVLVCFAARQLQRPIKWIEDRKEHFVATNHSRDQTHQVRAAVDNRGFILGIDDEFWTDQGAYVRTHAATVTDIGAALLPGPYIIPAFRARGHIMLTNKTPAGTYRAPGRYEGTFVRERLIDAIASQLNLDPLAVRRVNFIPADQMPFNRAIRSLDTHVTYDSGDYLGLLEHSLKHLDYEALTQSLDERRNAGELVGLGVAYFVEKSGLGPTDTVHISIDESGQIEVITGAASVGQGIETCIAQICAQALGADIADIRVIHGQTDRIENGLGAFASCVTVMTGSAAHIAATNLRARLLAQACKLFNAESNELDIDGSQVRFKTSDRSVSFSEIIASCKSDSGEPGSFLLNADGTFSSDDMAYPYGIHFAVVKIDSETCGIVIERYLVSIDIGRVVNPVLVEGQLVGGACQGIGGALFEDFVYDEAAQPMVTTFMDYLMPTAAEIPQIETLVVENAPSPMNPLGVKGAGEGGINACGAAIAAAVDDAIGRKGAITNLPITPQELHRLIC